MSDEDKLINELYEAANNYVKSKGGKILVAGKIKIYKYPGDKKYKFTLAIECTGKPPREKEPATKPDN